MRETKKNGRRRKGEVKRGHPLRFLHTTRCSILFPLYCIFCMRKWYRCAVGADAACPGREASGLEQTRWERTWKMRCQNGRVRCKCRYHAQFAPPPPKLRGRSSCVRGGKLQQNKLFAHRDTQHPRKVRTPERSSASLPHPWIRAVCGLFPAAYTKQSARLPAGPAPSVVALAVSHRFVHCRIPRGGAPR
jgi:hypothetical protein